MGSYAGDTVARFNPGLRADRRIDDDDAGEIAHNLRHAALGPTRWGNAKITRRNADDDRLEQVGHHVDLSTRRLDLFPAPLDDYRSYRLDVGCRDNNALEQSPFCGVLVWPIDRHEKRTPRHSWRD